MMECFRVRYIPAAMKAGAIIRQQIWISKPLEDQGLLWRRMRPM